MRGLSNYEANATLKPNLFLLKRTASPSVQAIYHFGWQSALSLYYPLRRPNLTCQNKFFLKIFFFPQKTGKSSQKIKIIVEIFVVIGYNVIEKRFFLPTHNLQG